MSVYQVSLKLSLPVTTASDNPVPSDEALARRAQTGDKDAFTTLVDRYQRGIVNLAYRLVGDWEAALDLAQDAFIRAYRSLDTFDPKRRFSPWLYRIATNRCYDHLRQQGRRPSVSLEEGEMEGDWADPVRRAEQHDLGQAIEDAIAALPLKYRVIVILRYLEDMSYQDIADTLDLPMGTVKTRIYRARERLRQALRQKGFVP